MTAQATVDNDWGTLYRDVPAVYEEFVSIPLTPSWVSGAKDVLPSDAHLAVDVGSGTGHSTLALARRVSRVVGVEPEPSMLHIATQRASNRRATGQTSIQWRFRLHHRRLDPDIR